MLCLIFTAISLFSAECNLILKWDLKLKIIKLHFIDYSLCSHFSRASPEFI